MKIRLKSRFLDYFFTFWKLQKNRNVLKKKLTLSRFLMKFLLKHIFPENIKKYDAKKDHV